MKSYTTKSAMFDIFMLIITGGWWFVWIVAKYFRTRTN